LLDVVARQMKNTVDCLIGYSVVATFDVPRLQKKRTVPKKAPCHEAVRLQLGWCLLDVVATL
jgi:hypothetical protein